MKHKQLPILVFLALASNQAMSGQVTIPNTFQSGQVASAAAVNANFSAVEVAVDDNAQRIAALEATIQTLQNTITSLQGRLTTVENNSALDLDGIITVDSPGGLQRVTFSGANVRIINGTGSTYGANNSVGNLVIGYSANPTGKSRTGSHNIVVGDEHGYTANGGVVFGFSNTISARGATVTGGNTNTASGQDSSVSGGEGNTASAGGASVSGGRTNTASGAVSSVTGGQSNSATAVAASVAGGAGNRATGTQSHVTGGGHPTITALGNVASGARTVILGGQGQTAPTDNTAIPAIP